MHLLIIIPDVLIEMFEAKNSPSLKFNYFKYNYFKLSESLTYYEFSDEFIADYQKYSFFPFSNIEDINEIIADLKELYTVHNYFCYDLYEGKFEHDVK